MEHKILDTLTEMGVVLSNYYPPSHKRLYALNRLKIQVQKTHHRNRKKNLTNDDKEKLNELYTQLEGYVEHYGVEPYQKYYIQLWKQSLVEILNGD